MFIFVSYVYFLCLSLYLCLDCYSVCSFTYVHSVIEKKVFTVFFQLYVNQ
ncbi:hypothetical protein IC582_014400 [Cucumis melo]